MISNKWKVTSKSTTDSMLINNISKQEEIEKSQKLRSLVIKVVNSSSNVLKLSNRLENRLRNVVNLSRKKRFYFFDLLFLKVQKFVEAMKNKYLNSIKSLEISTNELSNFEKNYKFRKRKKFLKKMKIVQKMIKSIDCDKQKLVKAISRINSIVNEYKAFIKM